MNIATALLALTELLKQVNSLGTAIRNAHAEGRTDLTDAEVESFAAKDTAARDRLNALIKEIEDKIV